MLIVIFTLSYTCLDNFPKKSDILIYKFHKKTILFFDLES